MIQDNNKFFNSVGVGIVNPLPDPHNRNTGDRETSPQPYDNYVSAFEFFDVLLNLFEELNILKDKDTDQDRIRFVQEYPDEDFNEDVDLVVFSLGVRETFTNSSIISGKPTIQRKPLELDSRYDIVSNNIKTDYANKFITECELQVFSKSLQRVHQVSKLIEAILFRYRGKLKLYVDNILYSGQSESGFHQGYFKNRLFCRSIKLQVITCETYSLVSEQLKYINNQ